MTRNAVILSAVAAIAIVALAWMFLISPQNEELSQVRADIQAEADQAVSLEAQISGLEQVRAVAPEIEAAIAEIEGIVPSDPGLPAALRQFQAAADDAGVTIESLVPARPVPVDDPAQPGLHELPVSLTIEGSYFQTVDFLRRIEDPAITSRGFEVGAMTMNRVDEDYPTLTVGMTGTMYAVLEEPPVPVEETAPATTTTDEAATPTDGATAQEDEA